MSVAYAELAVASNFSFLRGASHAQELVERAGDLGLHAIGIADRNTLAGVVRAHVAAKEAGLKLLVGARLVTVDGFETLCYPTDRAAYGRLCRLLTRGNKRPAPDKKRATKGECRLFLADILEFGEGQIFIVLPPHPLTEDFEQQLRALAASAPGRAYLAAAYLYHSDNARRLAELDEVSREIGTPLVATNDVHFHVPERQILQDVLTCIREKTTIAEAGFRLAANAERHLKSPAEMARLFARYPDAIARTMEIAARVSFSLDELKYSYPKDCIAGDEDPQTSLVRLTWEGAKTRYPDGVPDKIHAQLLYELELIGRLEYAPYFLTVWDIVCFARSKDILCQGRGSAANSAVCYVLGITAVDPTKMNLLVERFISASRNEPPDIDVDFEHERREEVMQYVYEKYGRERAGIAATVISYRSKSAIRDIGKALGLSLDVVGVLSDNLWGWGEESFQERFLADTGLDAKDPTIARAIELAREIRGFPRHLSQHVGGFVITDGLLEEYIPIGNAAMEDRTFVEWDKDDLNALGILKVDVLALGMLTCIAKSFALLKKHYGLAHDLYTVPQDDAAVYEMLQRSDSIGVFQVESRAQMSMLPRLKPECFNDIVVEVAIVRPGPIQGGMVHPYLRRREKKDEVTYPSKELEEVLSFTLGVPLFQEQAMQIAIVAAGFSPEEADRLRRAMATFRRSGTIHKFREQFVSGMLERNYEREFAESCFRQIEGFADYGFPMSHAASFAVLVYISAWLKRYYPDVFCAALLNAQPMGFYAPAQLVCDARDHGVEVLAPDVNHSSWDHTLEARQNPPARYTGACAVRLGFRAIKGLREEDFKRLMDTRGQGYDGVRHLALAAGLASSSLTHLAEADAFRSLGLDRRQALWAVKGLDGGATPARVAVPELPLFTRADPELLRRDEEVRLPPMRLGEHVIHDYASIGLSLKAHPLALLRTRMSARGVMLHADLAKSRDGARVRVGGLVLVRQRPGTAKGIIFITLEDETGIANVIVWPPLYEQYRRIIISARLLAVHGTLQRQGLVMHVVADHLEDLSADLDLLTADDTALTVPMAYADAVRKSARPDKRDGAPETPRLPRMSRDFH